jgi:hypothetical protein
MKYKVINEKPEEGTFIRVPQNIDFKLNPTSFKVLVWIIQHKDGFTMNEYFIKKGIGMDYRTFRKHIDKLAEHGSIIVSSIYTNSSNDAISDITVSYKTEKIVSLLTNKNKKQEEIKPEEKPEENKQEEVPNASGTLAQCTGEKDVDFDVVSSQDVSYDDYPNLKF